MDFVDLLRLLPRSALSDLGYSLIPGTALLFGVSWVRWDLATKFLAFPLLDPISKAVLVSLGVLSAGYLLLTVIGGLLGFIFMMFGAFVGQGIKSRVDSGTSYGTSIVWRRLAGSLLGEHISQVREAGWSAEQIQERMKAAFDKHMEVKSGDQEKLKTDLTAAVFGEASKFAADMLKQAETNSEWQAVYRILNEYLEYPPRQYLHLITAPLATGSVLWTLYHFWLTPVFPLWVAAFSATACGVFHAMSFGLLVTLSDRAQGLDEKQAVRMLSILIPRRMNLERQSD